MSVCAPGCDCWECVLDSTPRPEPAPPKLPADQWRERAESAEAKLAAAWRVSQAMAPIHSPETDGCPPGTCVSCEWRRHFRDLLQRALQGDP